jgi:Holliday junction resolvasome RuvABC endonuclease subunit
VLSRLVGVIILSGIQNDIDIIFYSPTNVKHAFTGNAKASKQIVIDKAQALTDVKLNSDMADAIAVAYTFAKEKNNG